MNALFIARLKILANDYGWETTLRGLAKLWAEVDPENALSVSTPKKSAETGQSAGGQGMQALYFTPKQLEELQKTAEKHKGFEMLHTNVTHVAASATPEQREKLEKLNESGFFSGELRFEEPVTVGPGKDVSIGIPVVYGSGVSLPRARLYSDWPRAEYLAAEHRTNGYGWGDNRPDDAGDGFRDIPQQPYKAAPWVTPLPSADPWKDTKQPTPEQKALLHTLETYGGVGATRRPSKPLTALQIRETIDNLLAVYSPGSYSSAIIDGNGFCRVSIIAAYPNSIPTRFIESIRKCFLPDNNHVEVTFPEHRDS